MSDGGRFPALRVAQLDVDALDDDVMRLLTSRLREAFKYTLPGLGDVPTVVETASRTALYAILTHYTLMTTGQTIGQRLLGLRYGDSGTLDVASQRKLRVLHVVLTFAYWRKSSATGWLSWESSTAGRWLSTFAKLASALNLVWFLRDGRYHTLLLRLLGLRTVHVSANPARRNINTSLLRRDLLWRGCVESAIFFLSLVNFDAARRWMRQLSRRMLADGSLAPSPSSERETTVCAFCNNRPTLPHYGECPAHVYCYYCATTAVSRDAAATCPACDVPIGIRLLPLQQHVRSILSPS